jgi:hypothetical protein
VSDPLRKVNRGDGIAPLFDARFFNTMVDTARAVQQKTGGAGGGFSPVIPHLEAYIIPTSTVLPYYVVSPTATPYTLTEEKPLHFREPVFNVAAPTGSSSLPMIVSRPAAGGELGRAVVQGLAVAAVDVSDEDHEFAVPIASDMTKMESAAAGSVRIIAPRTTGESFRLVLLTGQVPGSSVIAFDSDANNTNFTNITSDGTWTDAAVSVTLPGAGTYLLFGAATTDGLATAGTLGTAFALRMFSVTNSQTVPLNGPVVYSITISALNVQFRTTTSWQQIYTATGSDQIRIEAQRPPGMTWTHVRVLHANAGSSGFFTQIGYVKLG